MLLLFLFFFICCRQLSGIAYNATKLVPCECASKTFCYVMIFFKEKHFFFQDSENYFNMASVKGKYDLDKSGDQREVMLLQYLPRDRKEEQVRVQGVQRQPVCLPPVPVL